MGRVVGKSMEAYQLGDNFGNYLVIIMLNHN